MSELSTDYSDPPPTYEAVIETAIKDWLAQLVDPLVLPIDERTIGTLALLITRRLIKAGLIDGESDYSPNR